MLGTRAEDQHMRKRNIPNWCDEHGSELEALPRMPWLPGESSSWWPASAITRQEENLVSISCINPQKGQIWTDQTPLEVKPTITKTKTDDVFCGIILHLVVYFTKIHRGEAPLTYLVGDTEVICGCSQLFVRELNRFTFSQHQRHISCSLVGWICSCWQSYKGLDGSGIAYQ